MPYSKNSKPPEGERPLSPEERDQKIRELQSEQEDYLRRAIGDEFFEFLEEFDEPTNEWLRRVKQANKLRQNGCLCGIVERFNPYAGPHGIRQDLFQFIDIIALYPNSICAIQSCGSSFAEHNRTILENEIAPDWHMDTAVMNQTNKTLIENHY